LGIIIDIVTAPCSIIEAYVGGGLGEFFHSYAEIAGK